MRLSAEGRRAGTVVGWWIPWCLLTLVWVAFLPALGGSFVNLDDHENFVFNYGFRGMGWPHVRWAWTTFLIGVYQPLAWMLLEAEYLAFGMRPWGYHLTSVLLHAANTLLFYALTSALLARGIAPGDPDRGWRIELASGLAAALFAVHPLRVEVVAWVSCQPYLPCAALVMVSVLAYLRAHPDGGPASRAWQVVAFAAFAAAMLTKAVAAGLPFVLLTLDVYPLRRLGGRDVRRPGRGALGVLAEKVPFALLSATFLAVAVRARVESDALRTLNEVGLGRRAVQSLYGLSYYLAKLVWPSGLSVYHPALEVTATAPLLRALAVGLPTAVGLVGLALRRRAAAPVAALAVYGVMLAPNLGLLPVSNQVVSDRYSYLPTMSLFVLLASGLYRGTLPGRPWRAAVLAAVLATVAGLTALTWRQCLTWRTSESLWSHAIACGGGLGAEGRNAEIDDFLGRLLVVEKRPREAVVYLERARSVCDRLVRAAPANILYRRHLGAVLNNLGNARLGLGQAREAAEAYRRAVEQQDYLLQWIPSDLTTREYLGNHLYNRGLALHEIGRTAEALHDFDRSRGIREGLLRETPGRTAVREDLVAVEVRIGRLLRGAGRYDEARRAFERARALCEGLLRLHPDVRPYRQQRVAINDEIRGLTERAGRP